MLRAIGCAFIGDVGNGVVRVMERSVRVGKGGVRSVLIERAALVRACSDPNASLF